MSSFFGIVIKMYYREHLPPHFHAGYQGREAACDLSGNVLEGTLGSVTAERLVREWAMAHRRELESNWENARLRRPVVRIPPLE